MKVITIILGVLVMIAGVYCCTCPIATQVSIAGVFVIVMGIGMLIGGIGEILSWNDARKNGVNNGWTLASAIVSIVLGIILLCCDFFAAGIVLATFCAYLLAIWLIINGITRIGAALTLRKYGNNIAAQSGMGDPLSGSWVFVLALGVIMIIAGILCVASPLVLISFMGIVFGVSMIVAGLSVISLGVASPAK